MNKEKQEEPEQPEKVAFLLLEKHGTLDYHSHPFVGDLRPSQEDKRILRQLTWQEDSIIIEPTQRTMRINTLGAVGTVENAIKRDEEYYASLIWGD